MKSNATLEDYKIRDAYLIRYIESQIVKAEKMINDYDNEGHGRKSAYKDILFKLTKDDTKTNS